MLLLAAVDWLHYMFMIPLIVLSVFMVLVILVQRGRGGGLTGALGGMGGQSAFGTKAGDLFTRITIVVAAVWVLLAMWSLKVLNQQSTTAGLRSTPAVTIPVAPPGSPPLKTAESDSRSSTVPPAGKDASLPAEATPTATPTTPPPAETGDKGADAAKP
jgi:preprotein translocase subunit SecG